MASISGILRREARQDSDTRTQPKPPLLPTQNAAALTDDTEAGTSRAIAWDGRHDGIEELYSRLIRVATTEGASTPMECG